MNIKDDIAKAMAAGSKASDEALNKIGRQAVTFIREYDKSLELQTEVTERMNSAQDRNMQPDEMLRTMMAMKRASEQHDKAKEELVRLQQTVRVLLTE